MKPQSYDEHICKCTIYKLAFDFFLRSNIGVSDLDYVNILRLAAVSETLSNMIGSYCQQKLNYNILILTLLQVSVYL